MSAIEGNVNARSARVVELDRMQKRVEDFGKQLEESEGLTRELVEKLKTPPSFPNSGGSSIDTIIQLAQFLESAKRLPSLSKAYEMKFQMQDQAKEIRKETAHIKFITEDLRKGLSELEALRQSRREDKQKFGEKLEELNERIKKLNLEAK